MKPKKINQHKINIKELNNNSEIGDKLNKLYELNKKNTKKQNDNLIKLVADPKNIYNAYENLRVNAGLLTVGTDKEDNPDKKMNKEYIIELSKQLREGNFKWKPTKKIEIPKPGTNKKRPLGIPNFTDKLIQESIRLVLNCIYEPTFQEHEVNFGFRPNRSTHSAIRKIQEEKKGMTTAIEGDIKGAYDNVNFKKMMEILEKKITDRKLLKIIEEGFKAGVLFEGEIKINEKGVPQGGILSPILFNIYMSEFDEAARVITNKRLMEKNQIEKRTEQPLTKNYRKIKRTIEKIRKDIKKMYIPEQKKYDNLEKLKEKRDELRKTVCKINKTRTMNRGERELFFSYTRYADDWIILTNAKAEVCKLIKDELKEWLQNNLKLELSEEKTKITELNHEEVNFLGFTVYNQKSNVIKMKRNRITIKMRRNVGGKIGIDMKRIYSRFQTQGIINKELQPTHCNKYVILKTWQIIKTYLDKILGMYSYYFYPITDKSRMNVIYYMLIYSCYKTIAKREKTTIRQVIGKYGKDLKTKYLDPYNGKEKNIAIKSREAIVEWATKKAIERKTMEIEQKIENKKTTETNESKKLETEKYAPTGPRVENAYNYKDKPSSDSPFYETKINLRTEYKLKTHCSICGIPHSLENPIQLHHVKHVRKGKISGFTQIMRQLNRKTIPVCRKCHNKIHNGAYDGIALRNILDINLITA